jgi:adenylate cyclase
MICGLCGAPNGADAAFCSSCGVQLSTRCPNCTAFTHALARLCGNCGTQLNASQAPNPIATSQRAPRDSRRLVTVLFADIVGYTGMVESFGEHTEQVRTFMHHCFDILGRIVVDHGGTVEKFIGDAVCAVFGAPVVHEDDPERALSCALKMQEAMLGFERPAMDGRNSDQKLQLRIGISTGEVVAGTADQGGTEHYTVTGDAVNTAARLQSHAEPGQITVSEATERLARDRFVFEPAGEVKLKGKRAPVRTHILLGSREAHLPTGTDFVGREREMDQLWFCFDSAARDGLQLVEIVGEAGVGKSRLVSRFIEAAGPDATICRGSCPPMASAPLQPFRDIVRCLLAAHPDEAESAGDPDLTTARHLLEALVNDEADVDGSSDPETVAQTVLVFLSASAGRTAVILENAHRADPDTLQVLRLLTRGATHSGSLLIWTRRTGEEPVVQGDTAASLTRLTLRPLSAMESRRLLDLLLGESSMPEPMADLVVQRSGGNPLYIEAIVRMLLEEGDLREASGDRIDVPATVQSLIQARLDNLPEHQKLLLQEAAVVGREFEVDLLEEVDLFGVDVAACLDALAERGMLERAGGRAYRFHHVLTQEVAYDTMLETLRMELHRELADTLLERNPDRIRELAPIIADHYAKAGDTERAVEILVESGSGGGVLAG